MRGSVGCVIAGVLALGFLYVAFYIAGMIEPGFAILILVLGIFVGAGVLVAAVVGVAELFSQRREGPPSA